MLAKGNLLQKNSGIFVYVRQLPFNLSVGAIIQIFRRDLLRLSFEWVRHYQVCISHFSLAQAFQDRVPNFLAKLGRC